MNRFAGPVLSAAFLAAPTFAQQPAQVPRASASVELSLFNLDVVVTDEKGQRVHGLTADDFEVRHDGRPVKLTNFSEIRSTASAQPVPAPAGTRAPAQPPAAAAAPRPPRRLVLFFDRLYIPEGGPRKQLFASLRGLLEKTLEEDDEAMIVTWNRSIRTVLPFTGDPERLEQSLASIERQAARIASEQGEQTMLRDEDIWFTSLANDPMIGSDFGGFTPTAELFAQQAFFEMKAKTAALRGLAATLGGMEGKKVLVLVSHRFSRYAGLEYYLRPRSGPEALGDPRTKDFDTKRLLEDVARAANANGVTFYGLFPAGLGVPGSSAADPSGSSPALNDAPLGGREQIALANELEALDLVAGRTGGLAAAGPGSVAGFVDRLSSDLDSWYSLGYPSPGVAGKAASVTVAVRGRKLTVRFRGSLVEKTSEEQMRDRVLAHLFKPDARAKIPIQVTASPAAGAKGKSRVRLEIQVPISSLVLLPTEKGAKGSFSVFVAAIAPEGDFSEVTRKSQPFEISAKDLETAKTGHYTYELEVETAGPDVRVCVGVWDEKGNDAGFAVVKHTGSPAPTPLPSPG